ncbi:beta-lactamase-like protein [Amanita rubescens]|nr:beta-lactamase-like protein [Amanita rubescens]
MRHDMAITFLGTSSGGGPTRPRNCSSLVCDLLNDGSLWMVDCAEGTTRQFLFQPYGHPLVRASKITKLFITHMHADHVMGIITLLRNVLHPPSVGQMPQDDLPPRCTVEIYGPAGLRSFVRQNFKMTATHTADKYVVHELLNRHDHVTPCDDSPFSQMEDSDSSQHPGHNTGFHDWNIRHSSEECGRDIYAGEDNFWRGITSGQGRHGDVIVDAGPIYHRGSSEIRKLCIADGRAIDPCIGYVFRESSDPHRKIVILGDTSNPDTIIPLCINPSPSLLIHEATDAHIPHHIDAKLGRRNAGEVLSKTISRGHSSPAMAGTFANVVGARRLVLNHVGTRFPGRSEDANHRNWLILSEIQNQASHAWGSGRQAEVAFDYMRVVIPGRQNQEIRYSHSDALSLSI